MKKSSSNSKRKIQSSSENVKRKRTKSSPSSKVKLETQGAVKKVPRKSRWEDPKPIDDKETAKKVDVPDPIVPVKPETASGFVDTSSIKELLNEKEKIVEHLFLAMSGTALQELIPDYLKERSITDLKKLCLEELQKMTNDDILEIISEKKYTTLNEQGTQTDTDEGFKSTSTKDEVLKTEKTCSRTDHVGDNNNKCVGTEESVDVENQAPEEILEEVAKDLGVSNVDPELLELEMRARAIRSLLKIKSPDEMDTETLPASTVD